MRRPPSATLFFCCLTVLVAPMALLNCSEPKALGAGEECFQATDCQLGLVCAPVRGKRVCTNDLSGIENPAQMDAGGMDASPGDGSLLDAPRADTSTGSPDSSTLDSGSLVDAGQD